MKSFILLLSIYSCSCVSQFQMAANTYDIRNMCTDRVVQLRDFMNIRVDNSFPAEEKTIIKRSFKKWQSAIKSVIIFNITEEDISSNESLTWDCDKQITIYNGNKEGFRSGRYESGVGGVMFTDSKDVFIFNSRFKNKVIIHEIGHIILGENHSSNKEDIMYYIALNDDNNIPQREQIRACLHVTALLYPHIPDKLSECE